MQYYKIPDFGVDQLLLNLDNGRGEICDLLGGDPVKMENVKKRLSYLKNKRANLQMAGIDSFFYIKGGIVYDNDTLHIHVAYDLSDPDDTPPFMGHLIASH